MAPRYLAPGRKIPEISLQQHHILPTDILLASNVLFAYLISLDVVFLLYVANIHTYIIYYIILIKLIDLLILDQENNEFIAASACSEIPLKNVFVMCSLINAFSFKFILVNICIQG